MNAVEDVETEVWYGDEIPVKKYAKCNFSHPNGCLIIYHMKPESDLNGDNLETGLMPHSPIKHMLFLRLELRELNQILKIEKPLANVDNVDITHQRFLQLDDTDGQSHYLRFPKDQDCDIWLAKWRMWKFKSIPETTYKPPTTKVLSNPLYNDDENTSSSDETIDDANYSNSSLPITPTDPDDAPPVLRTIEESLAGRPQDYPALANWTASLVKYGFGWKKGAKRKNWKRRFFVLTQHSFCYFQSEKKKNPIASHSLSNVISVYRRIDLKDHQYVLAIDMRERTHFWEFKTESILREWLQDFSDTIPVLGKVQPFSTRESTTTQQPPVPKYNLTSSLPVNNLVSNKEAASSRAGSTQVVYETHVVGGVVVKKPVNRVNSGNQHNKITELSDSGESDDSTQLPEPSVKSLKSCKAVQSIHPDLLVKYDFLTKEGGVVHNWKRRLFVLTKQSLLYFKSESETTPLRFLKLCNVVSVAEVLDYQNRSNVLCVAIQKRQLYIQTDTPQQLKEWLDEINKCVDIQRRFKPFVKSESVDMPSFDTKVTINETDKQ